MITRRGFLGAGLGTLAGTSMPNPVNSAVGGIVAGGIQGGPMVQDAAATAGQGIGG